MAGIDQLERLAFRIEQELVSIRACEKLAYSIDEAASATAIGRTSLYEDMTAGVLPSRKRGRHRIILKADLIAYLDSLPHA